MSALVTIKHNRQYLSAHRRLLDIFLPPRAKNDNPFVLAMDGDDLTRAWHALGLEVDPPECRGTKLLESLGILAIYTPEAEARCVAEKLYPAQVMMLEAGIPRERVPHYAGGLVVIANEACRREEMVVWV